MGRGILSVESEEIAGRDALTDADLLRLISSIVNVY
jgi:hypothetical protein